MPTQDIDPIWGDWADAVVGADPDTKSQIISRTDSNVPVGSALLENGTQVPAQLFHRPAAEEPVAHVDLGNDQTRLEHKRVRDHGIVGRIGVFSDIKILLNDTPGVGQK